MERARAEGKRDYRVTVSSYAPFWALYLACELVWSVKTGGRRTKYGSNNHVTHRDLPGDAR